MFSQSPTVAEPPDHCFEFKDRVGFDLPGTDLAPLNVRVAPRYSPFHGWLWVECQKIFAFYAATAG